MNLAEFLKENLPSDYMLSHKPKSASSILSKRNGTERGSNIRRRRGRSIRAGECPKVGDSIRVRQGDGSEKEYKVLRLITNDEEKPVKAVVALPGGWDRRIVSLKIGG